MSKVTMHPDCYDPRCLNKETQCDKCNEYIELPSIDLTESIGEKSGKATKLRPIDPEKVVPPYMEVKDGYGYMGTLLYSDEEDKVQCHFCGELFNQINPAHLKLHGLTTDSYREKYELNKTTPLATPKVSAARSLRAEFNYKLNYGQLTSQEIKTLALKMSKRSQKVRRQLKIKQKWTVEMMNRYGTCPKQVEERFTRMIEEFEGKAPSWDQLYAKDPSLLAVLSRRFKGYSNALLYFGFKPRRKVPPGKNKAEYGQKAVEYSIKEFVKKNKRLPNAKDTKVGVLPDYMTIVRYFGDWWKAKEFAFRYLAMEYPSQAADYDEKFMRKRYPAKALLANI